MKTNALGDTAPPAGPAVRWTLLGIVVAGALARLGGWRRVFIGDGVYTAFNDGWYHLRRAQLTLAQWPHVPQFDEMINAPSGGPITWGVAFDWLLATLALPWRSDPLRALEWIGAFLPVVLGVVQILLVFALLRTLAGVRAALLGSAATALIPGVIAHTIVGGLDHDPLIEICLLLALWSVSDPKRSLPRSVLLLATALGTAFLAWAGSVILAGLFGCVLLALWEKRAFEIAALGSGVAAIVILPFVLTSVWPGATFEGLSLLHEATLAGLAGVTGGLAVVRGSRVRLVIVTAIVGLIVATALAPIAAAPFLRGLRFAGAGAAISKDVAEAQPLLSHDGRFDLRPLLTTITIVPVVAIPLLLAIARSRGAKSRAARLLLAWVVPATLLALPHLRLAYGAAAAAAAAFGLTFDYLLDRYPKSQVAALALIVALPASAAYVQLPGWKHLYLYAPHNSFVTNGLVPISVRLAARPEGNVWCPWSFGHVIVYNAGKPVVMSPFLNIGQSHFGDASRFYFVTNLDEAEALLDSLQVRYVVVTANAPAVTSMAAAAGADPTPLLGREGKISARGYLRTIQGRLALAGPFGPFREIDRSRAVFNGPLGRVPLVRVYEYERPARNGDAR